jgi:hypothetical protein
MSERYSGIIFVCCGNAPACERACRWKSAPLTVRLRNNPISNAVCHHGAIGFSDEVSILGIATVVIVMTS